MKRAAFLAIASAALLAGCGPSSHKDLVDWMNEQGKGVRGHLAPLPTIKPYEPFVYNDFDLPDPFKPRKIEPTKSDNTNKLAPDLNRRKEPLEAYPLESLSMVGTLEKGRTRYALVKTPDKDLYQVRQGMHMGQNYGVITDVTDTDIKLKELMQDGSGDWSERTSTLNLLQADSKTQERRK
jgi:type IV pilus assembly protein PilP